MRNDPSIPFPKKLLPGKSLFINKYWPNLPYMEPILLITSDFDQQAGQGNPITDYLNYSVFITNVLLPVYVVCFFSLQHASHHLWLVTCIYLFFRSQLKHHLIPLLLYFLTPLLGYEPLEMTKWVSFIHSLVHLLNEYLLSINHMPGTVPVIGGDIAMNKTKFTIS